MKIVSSQASTNKNLQASAYKAHNGKLSKYNLSHMYQFFYFHFDCATNVNI